MDEPTDGKKELFPAIAVVERSAAPSLIRAAGRKATTRFFEFFAANIRNRNTREAYHRALVDFFAWCEDRGFVLYAEDRDLLSSDAVYTNHYSVTGLFERLRADAGRYPDTMDQRFGAWAQFLTLFRLIYEGGSHGGLKIPARKGYLFDPDRYNFLEGRPWKTARRNVDSAASVHLVRARQVERFLDPSGQLVS